MLPRPARAFSQNHAGSEIIESKSTTDFDLRVVSDQIGVWLMLRICQLYDQEFAALL